MNRVLAEEVITQLWSDLAEGNMREQDKTHYYELIRQLCKVLDVPAGNSEPERSAKNIFRVLERNKS